jgi:hypothetical protein
MTAYACATPHDEQYTVGHARHGLDTEELDKRRFRLNRPPGIPLPGDVCEHGTRRMPIHCYLGQVALGSLTPASGLSKVTRDIA